MHLHLCGSKGRGYGAEALLYVVVHLLTLVEVVDDGAKSEAKFPEERSLPKTTGTVGSL